jgi:hypothetical protein
MSIETTIPQNRNFLAQPNFRFFIKKTPNVNYFIQDINLPGISIPQTEHPNPFTRIPYSGDHIDWEPLNVTFMVDEDMANYLEIWNWLVALGFPQNHDQYRALASIKKETGDGMISDASLMLLSSKMNSMFDITFIDAFPVALSGINFSSTTNDYQFLTATATFAYTYYTINSLL